jgi:predicted metal-binding membrane protein
MDKLQKTLLISLISTSAVTWYLSTDQPNMMIAMMTYNPKLLSLFIVSWTAGMAAMMFPAISPMVLLYNKMIKTNNGEAVSVKSYSSRMILFVGSYLGVWALTGLALLLMWSVAMNAFLMEIGSNQLFTVYGILLIISGAYQFSPLKTKCLGYCESPMSFFMRRWRSGTTGAARMGTYHGLYCLGCCWPYFLLMVALGWMHLLWMGLFAGIIFGEKVWSRGILVARAAGIGFMILGLMALLAPDLDILHKIM